MEVVCELEMSGDMLDAKRGSQRAVFHIFWRHQGVCYPDSDWYDIGGVVMGWWLSAMKRLLKGSEQEDFVFMEGPYEINATRGEDASCLNLSLAQRDVTWQISRRKLAERLLHAAIHMQKQLQFCGLEESEDVLTVGHGILELQAALSQAENAA